MIKKAGHLAKAEARVNGFFIKGKKVKAARLTQEQVDEWNGVKAAPVAVEEVVVEEVETDEPVVEEKPKSIFKKKRKK